MTRLSFSPLMRDAVLAGNKTMTTRYKKPSFKAGDTIAAVCAEKGPGFLVPVKDRFATLKVIAVSRQIPLDCACVIYGMEGFKSVIDYLEYLARLNPRAMTSDYAFVVEFKVLDHGEGTNA